MQDTFRAGIMRYILKQIIFLMITAGVLFFSAGTLRWPMGTAYVISLLMISIVNTAVMDPSLLVERSKLQRGTKRWDIAVSAAAAIWGPLLVCAAAGLDFRFRWSMMPWGWLQVSALAVFITAALAASWAMKSNAFFASTVRIQHDRNHQVVSAGPYRFVRHPGYLAGAAAAASAPLALGSLAALIPGILTSLLFILRTYLEDRTLMEELEGYREYAQRVPYRLIPGIW